MGKQKNPKDSHPWDCGTGWVIGFKQKVSNTKGFCSQQTVQMPFKQHKKTTKADYSARYSSIS